ncbi:MAG: MmcQ/YjbR family DNA-binding protein [Sphingobacteriales bacterium]
MVDLVYFRQMALSFPETNEEPHFEKTSFRVRKKIFATYDETKNRACLKLTEADQDIFSLAAPGIIYPVDNKWGKQGWTLVELAKVRKKLFSDALISAYKAVAPPKLVEQM